MTDMIIWSRPLPQGLIIRDLSNQNHRHRIARINHEDAIMLETAQQVYARLGFGNADGEFVILERGLEEAIKPNLDILGYKLAGDPLQQQFDMGVGIGRSDLICTDKDGDLIVLELKRGMASDQAIGQVLTYIGWMKENIAEPGQEVKGCILAGDYDERLRLAAAAAGIRLVLVRLG
jgi:RecB family endonuclease NucS